MTELILNDAQAKQQSVKKKMEKLEVDCLLGKRDSLMAQGVMCQLLDSDCQNIILSVEEDVSGNSITQLT